ncbi:MAG TPA: fumarylacetoacetate hydrolase family protein [Acidimicrobiales bacterium]|nr:fumarylacetoacetate hydrolase family protein [Acidimicrobiales bacterium]
MKLVTFADYRIGVHRDDGIHDVSSAVPGWQPGDLLAMNRLIAGWAELRGAVEQAAGSAPALPRESVRLQAPNPAPMHLFAAPSNYRAHQQEMDAAGFRIRDDSGPRDSADTLGFFLKATGSVSGPEDAIELPLKDLPERRFDHEGEIAVVVGAPAEGISPEEAERYIFGYTIVVDVTLRTTPEHREERVQRKSFASFSPMGPCIVTADELPDWRGLNVKLWVNGEQRQDAHATDLIVDIPNLLSRASHVLPLRAGDVYTTGSPAGVGAIAPGDTVEVQAEGIGSMSLPVTIRAW